MAFFCYHRCFTERYAIVAEFKKRRDIIVAGLNRIPGIRCAMPKGAFYTFPNVEGTGMTSAEFADGLSRDGTLHGPSRPAKPQTKIKPLMANCKRCESIVT